LLQQRAAAVRLGLLAGDPCWELLEEQGFLNSKETKLIESAQSAGNLPWALNILADSLDRKWQYQIQSIIEFIRPIVIVAIGIIVGIFAVAMFLPLIKLINDQA